MPKEPIDFSGAFEEIFAGGATFVPGDYEVTRSRFTYFDFAGQAKETLCFMQELQPLANGKPEGEVQTKYWSLMDTDKKGNRTVEPCNPVKGEKGMFSAVRMTENNTHDQLFKFSNFAIFMEHLKKIPDFDTDTMGNDITSLDGNRFEYGIFVSKTQGKTKTAIEAAEEGEGGDKKAAAKRESYDIIVPVAVVTSKGGKGKAADKPAAKETAKPAAKGGKAKSDDPLTLIEEFVNDEVMVEANEGGVTRISQRLKLGTWLKKKGYEIAQIRDITAKFNDDDTLGALLNANGWECDADSITQSE